MDRLWDLIYSLNPVQSWTLANVEDHLPVPCFYLVKLIPNLGHQSLKAIVCLCLTLQMRKFKTLPYLIWSFTQRKESLTIPLRETISLLSAFRVIYLVFNFFLYLRRPRSNSLRVGNMDDILMRRSSSLRQGLSYAPTNHSRRLSNEELGIPQTTVTRPVRLTLNGGIGLEVTPPNDDAITASAPSLPLQGTIVKPYYFFSFF